MRLADTGKRVIAYIIDAVIVGIVVAIIIGITEVLDFPEWLQAIISIVLAYGYFIYMEGTTGQTLGKRALNIRVINEDGTSINMGTSAIRNILRIVDMFFFGIVGLILIIVTQKKQRVGDLAARTVVIDA
jgi:uncharacterized RDD family membrane protein YckC